MHYTPTLLVHIVGGIIGVVSGSTALLSRKGSPIHRLSGKVFAVSMLAMAAGGAYLAFLKMQRFNVLAGVLTSYLVATAWLTVRRKPRETGTTEKVLLAVALTAAAAALFFAAASTKRGDVIGYSVFATLALLFALSDVRMLVRGGLAGAKRIARHLWRMGFALFVAAGSFFLGTASDPVLRKTGLRAQLFTKDIRATHLPEIPVYIIVGLTLYWLIRVRFAKEYKTAPATQLAPEK
jgi:uncharacterized membrane protein